MNKAKLLTAAALSTFALCASADTINLVQNSGFEDGDAYWEHNIYFAFLDNPGYTTSGPGFALSICRWEHCLGKKLGDDAFLRQVLPTTPGERYDLSFWTRNEAAFGEYLLYWDGKLVNRTEVSNGPMQLQQYTDLIATGSTTELEIKARSDDYEITFDDFGVYRSGPAAVPGPLASVPEPASVAMLAAGLTVFGILRRRRRED